MLKKTLQIETIGHSIRIGGATQLLLNGVPPQIVQYLGGWSSESSFMKYWRNVNALISVGAITGATDLPEETKLIEELTLEA
ncbi:hypothetical protein JCM8097_001975 [Rhodosporidiobolus ruineniae]